METTDTLQVRVECYAGYRGDQQPMRFYLKKRCIQAVDILDQWAGPDYRYFKLRGDDDGVYILRHSEKNDTWEMTLFDGGRHQDTRLSST